MMSGVQLDFMCCGGTKRELTGVSGLALSWSQGSSEVATGAGTEAAGGTTAAVGGAEAVVRALAVASRLEAAGEIVALAGQGPVSPTALALVGVACTGPKRVVPHLPLGFLGFAECGDSLLHLSDALAATDATLAARG